MKRLGHIVTWILASVVLLILVGVLITQTPMFRSFVRNKVVDSVNNIVDAQFSIGELKGNLFNHIELRDVRLIRHDDTIAYITRVDVGIKPIRLLDDNIVIDSLIIDSMAAIVRQYSDSSWNIAGLIKEDTILEDTSKETSPFKHTVNLGDFILRNSSARIIALDTAMPRRFDDMLLHFSADYAADEQRLELKELQFETVDPTFRLERLALVATRDGDSISVADFVMETRQNRVEASGEYDPSTPREGKAEIASGPLKLEEFRRFLPNLSLPVSPQLVFDGRLVKDTLFADIGLHMADQSTTFDIAAYPISKALNSQTINQVHYRVDGTVNNIDVARWTGDTTFAYELNGTFTLDGHGVKPEAMEASFTADLSDLRVLGRDVREAIWDVDYVNGSVDGTMRMAGTFGEINFDALTFDILNTQQYRASFSTRQLDLAQLFNDTTLRSDLNVAVVASGARFDPDRATGNVRLTIDQSTMYGFQADTGFAQVAFAPDDYRIDTAFVSSPYGTIDMAGQLSERNGGELRYVANISDLSKLRDFVKTDTLHGAAILTGTARGGLDSLITRGEYQFKGLVYNQISIDSGVGEFDFSRIKEKLAGNTTISLDELAYTKYFIDTVSGKFSLDDSVYTIEAEFRYQDSLQGKLTVDVIQGVIPTYVVRDIDVNLYGQQWQGGSDETTIRVRGDAYEINELALTSGAAGNQRIWIDGIFSMSGAENLRLEVAALDIVVLARLLGYEYPVTGSLTSTVSLTGTAQSPIIEGNAELADGTLNRFKFQSLVSTFAYEPGTFTLNGQLTPTEGTGVTVEGFVPMRLSFTDTTGDLINRDRPMQLTVGVNQLPLTVLEALGDQIQTTGGWIGGEFTLAGSLNEPDMAGEVAVHDGGFIVKRYGVEYTDFEMGLIFDNERIRLDSLRISRGKGFMRATGELDFSGGLMDGTLSTTDIDWHSEQFYLVRHSNFEIQLTGDAKLQGPTASPQFSGDITVDRSRIYIPILSDEAKKGIQDIPRPPLLVQATGSQFKADTTSAVSDSVMDEEAAMASVDFYKNLRGTATLTIPRNTWLTGPDMNIEIGGDLQLVKNSPEAFEIFGPIRIVRGKYALFGKRFEIREGTLTFTGGEDIDPDIDMNADYTFRTPDKTKRILRVHVTGKAFNPTLDFALDGSDIPERDAIAYIVFGKTMAEVTGPGGGGSFEGTDFARGVAANALASQLAQTLGKRFALDVVEINSGGSFQSATVTVGKYITNDLFMSYQRGLGEATADEVTPTIVTLEYELTKNLSAQLIQGESESSGFDLIFKFDY